MSAINVLGGARGVAPHRQRETTSSGEIQPFVVRSDRKQLKKHSAALKATSARIAESVAKDDYQAAADLRMPYERTLDGFAHLLQTGEELTLIQNLQISAEQLEDARAFMREEPCDLTNVRKFADKWAQAMNRDAAKAEILALPWGARVNTFIENFNTASSRITCHHTQVDDFATQEPQPEFDIAKQKSGFVANAASRAMWGASGAAAAIQAPMTKAFKTALMSLKSRFGNLVGNAQVADSYVVPVTAAMKRDGIVPAADQEPLVIASSAGPNPKHSTGARVKVPRLSHLRNPNAVSSRQQRKLDAAYASDFEGRRLYNLQAEGRSLPLAQTMAVTPKSSGVFGYPKDKSAEVLARRTLFTMSLDPDLKVKMLTVNAPESADSFSLHANVFVRHHAPQSKANTAP